MDRKDFIIEDFGNYRGMDWVVRFVERGHRCGYVRIEDDALFDKYVKENEENIMIPSLDVHGGITFIEKLEDGNGFGLPSGNWIGFDAAHAWDITDYQSARKYFGNNERYDQLEQMDLWHCIKDASVKTKEYMVSECKSLIEQILAKSVSSVKSVNTLESLVPPLDLCKQIPAGKFQDSALVWDYKIGRWTNQFRVRKRELFDTHICPAPTLQEIMQELGKDFFVPTLSMQGAVWQVECEFVDVLDDYRTEIKTIIDSRASTAAMKLWFQIYAPEFL